MTTLKDYHKSYYLSNFLDPVQYAPYLSRQHHFSAQVFIVRPNAEIGTDVLWLDVVLPRKVGHQHRIIICVALISIPMFGRTTAARRECGPGGGGGGSGGWKTTQTCMAQRSFAREHRGPALLFHLDRITCAIRVELRLQLG